MILGEIAGIGILAGLLTTLSAAAPAAPMAMPPMACHISAFVESADPKGLSVRLGPGNQYALLKQLPIDKSDTVMLMIRAGQGNWMKITDVQNTKGQLLFAGPGWVYGPLLATSIRPDLEGDSVSLFAAPDSRTAAKAKAQNFSSVHILYCQGGWVKVRAAAGEGWLQPHNQCGNPIKPCQ